MSNKPPVTVVGDIVRVQDAHGYWTLRPVADVTVTADTDGEYVTLRGQTWKSLRFYPHGTDGDGRPLFVSRTSVLTPTRGHCCPEGWHRPAQRV